MKTFTAFVQANAAFLCEKISSREQNGARTQKAIYFAFFSRLFVAKNFLLWQIVEVCKKS